MVSVLLHVQHELSEYEKNALLKCFGMCMKESHSHYVCRVSDSSHWQSGRESSLMSLRVINYVVYTGTEIMDT